MLTAMSFALSRTVLSLWSKSGPTAFRIGVGLITRTPKALRRGRAQKRRVNRRGGWGDCQAQGQEDGRERLRA